MNQSYKFLLLGVASAISLQSYAAGHMSATSSSVASMTVKSEWSEAMPEAPKTNPALTAGAQPKAASMANTRVHGFLMYDDDKNEESLGFYEYTLSEPINRRQLLSVPRQYVGGDAVVVNGKLYSFHLDYQYGWVNSAFYTVIDVATGQATKSSNISYDTAVAYSHAATSAALSPFDGKVYCSGYTYNDEDKTLTPTLKIWDVESNTKTDIGTMEASLTVMTFAENGVLYGITASSSKTATDGGRLVSVDLNTGELTLIADTGIRPYFDQSAFYLRAMGIYWFANEPVEGGDANAAKSTLYRVSITGEVETIGSLPNGDEVVGAWIPEQTISDNAPGAVSEIYVEFGFPTFNGKISFRLPTETYSGGELTENVNWTVKNGDKELASGTGAPGQEITADITVPQSGDYSFLVNAYNEHGDGLIDEISTYIGYGTPKAPTNVNFTIEDGKNLVSWTHSDGLVGKGYLVGEHPSYRIVRQPDNVVLEENWTENSYEEPALSGALQSTFYEITPVNGDMTGAAAKSNALVTGSSLALPYSEDFTEASSFDLYTAIDANADNNTWYYSVKSAKIRQVTSGSQDDWLILPPVELQEGYSYEFSFNCYGTQVANDNLIDVSMGLSTDEMNIPLLSDIQVTDTKSTAMKEVAVTIKPDATAVYRLGIHIKSGSRQGTFTVDDIAISVGKSTAIPAAPEFTVTPGESGAHSAVIDITLPSLTAGGKPLNNRPTQLKVLRDEAVIATLDVNEDENEYTFTDSSITESGSYTYSVCAINVDGEGEIASHTLFIGVDAPQKPTGFVANDNFDGTVTLSWDEPSNEGLNGGYVHTPDIRYTITHPDGTTTSDIAETSAVVPHDTTGDQREVQYSLAVHYAGAQPAATHTVPSNTLIAGQPYNNGINETFPVNDDVAAPSTSLWTTEVVEGKSTQISMAVRTDDDHTGDGSGCLHFTGYATDATGRWISPVMDISEMAHPEVSLWVKTADDNSKFELQVSKEYGPWETIASPETATDWTEVKAPLSDYSSKHVRLGFLAKSLNNMSFTYADDIKVHDSKTVAIDEITDSDISDSETEIYTLQGIRVNGTPASGIYILRRGDDVQKVVLP